MTIILSGFRKARLATNRYTLLTGEYDRYVQKRSHSSLVIHVLAIMIWLLTIVINM